MDSGGVLRERTSAHVRELIQDGRAPTVVVPVGSIEQHGPHLPLDTDTRIAESVAAAAAAELPGNVLVAAALSYGASGEHQGFAGTISLGTATLTAVLIEYGRSVCDWASRVVSVKHRDPDGGAHRVRPVSV